jgi:hypothetical protein
MRHHTLAASSLLLLYPMIQRMGLSALVLQSCV